MSLLISLVKRFLSQDVEESKQIASYVLLEKINSGGMADIYKAQDKKTGQIYAIKVLFAESAERTERLCAIFDEPRVEHDSSLFFDHPNIVRVYKTDKYRGRYYIVMELIKGDSLQKILAQETPLSYLEKIQISLQIAQGIQYLHQRGVIHNDINPKNIMITPENNVKIIDFGIAMRVGSKMHKRAGMRAGTPAYMAPEQIRGLKVDPRTDIYNLGVTLYELFSGQTPFKGKDSVDKMQKHLNMEPADITDRSPDINPRLAHLIMKSIQRNPDDRFQSTSDICAILSQLVREETLKEQFM